MNVILSLLVLTALTTSSCKTSEEKPGSSLSELYSREDPNWQALQTELIKNGIEYKIEDEYVNIDGMKVCVEALSQSEAQTPNEKFFLVRKLASIISGYKRKEPTIAEIVFSNNDDIDSSPRREKNGIKLDCAKVPDDENQKSPMFSRINRMLELLRLDNTGHVFFSAPSFRKKNRINTFTSEQFYNVLLAAIPKISANLSELKIRNELDATEIAVYARISYEDEPGYILRRHYPKIDDRVDYVTVFLPLPAGLSKEAFQKQVNALVTLKKSDVLRIVQEKKFLGKELTYDDSTYKK